MSEWVGDAESGPTTSGAGARRATSDRLPTTYRPTLLTYPQSKPPPAILRRHRIRRLSSHLCAFSPALTAENGKSALDDPRSLITDRSATSELSLRHSAPPPPESYLILALLLPRCRQERLLGSAYLVFRHSSIVLGLDIEYLFRARFHCHYLRICR